MTQKYEKVDLGNVKGNDGKNGNDGVGIEEFRFIRDINPTTHLYHVVYTDEGKAPTEVILHDGDVTIVERALENYIQKSNTSGLIRNDGTIDITQYSTFDGSYDNLLNTPNIPSDVADLRDDNNTQFTPRTHNHGEIQNDGTINNQIITFDNNDVPLVADYSANNGIKLGKISTDYLIDPYSHAMIGTDSEDTVSTVLRSINTKLTDINSNIAEIVNSLKWKQLSLTNMVGFTLYYNNYFCHLIMNRSGTLPTAGTYTNLVNGTIPSGYRPKMTTTIFADGTANIRVKVNDSGNVLYYTERAFTSSATIRGTFTWARNP